MWELIARRTVANFTASLWLVAWPAYILLRMKLPQTHQRLLIACFSASFLLGVVYIVSAIYLIKGTFIAGVITGHLSVSSTVYWVHARVSPSSLGFAFTSHLQCARPCHLCLSSCPQVRREHAFLRVHKRGSPPKCPA